MNAAPRTPERPGDANQPADLAELYGESEADHGDGFAGEGVLGEPPALDPAVFDGMLERAYVAPPTDDSLLSEVQPGSQPEATDTEAHAAYWDDGADHDSSDGAGAFDHGHDHDSSSELNVDDSAADSDDPEFPGEDDHGLDGSDTDAMADTGGLHHEHRGADFEAYHDEHDADVSDPFGGYQG